jgi:FixJ family two-component response regulator
MPTLLLVAGDTKSYFSLLAAAEAKGFRVKATVDPKVAREWAELSTFDLTFVDETIETSLLQALAHTLWQRNPRAPLIAYSTNEIVAPERIQELKLLGADTAFGPQVESALSKILDWVKDQAPPTPSTPHIMVVEDLDSPRDIICYYIESLGLGKVSGINSAKKALSTLESDPGEFTCIITDIKMPKMNGKELIESVRRHAKLQHLPIVVLTAYGTVDTLIECLKAGASGFLVKPPKKEDLVREIGRAMRLYDQKQNPRLALEREAEEIRALLLEKGFS